MTGLYFDFHNEFFFFGEKRKTTRDYALVEISFVL